MNDYISAALPHITALALTLVGLAVFEQLRGTGRRWVYWAIAVVAIGLWAWSLIVTELGVHEARQFKARRQEVADSIRRELHKARTILDQLENDQDYQFVPRCGDKDVLDRYERRVEQWKEKVQRDLDELLPGSGATRRFRAFLIRYPFSACPRMDFTYWKLFTLHQNLSHIWESVDQYCARVGPTCRNGGKTNEQAR